MKSNVADKSNKARAALAPLLLAAVIAFGTGDNSASQSASASRNPVSAECTRWAESFGHNIYAVHEAGCDNDGNGNYVRANTKCAAAARRNVRAGYVVGSVDFRVRVANVGQRCVLFEDGSWGAE